ncbi:MAG: isoprenylcysteine carboxylmethyltransferase family protein [Thermoguttaceae bacterium]|nr:isoprenylcysteine carboxylmethyltransferase family protein [Thermoguttaceae bacterium]MDW8039300.1 isoprenylcysteine carboxylmethyltransferase family protein [Thermoguttaceae bacterium]
MPQSGQQRPSISPSATSRWVHWGRWMFRHRGWVFSPLGGILFFQALASYWQADTHTSQPIELVCLAAIILVSLGVYIRLHVAGRARPGTSSRGVTFETGQLITTGMYAYVRNPLYLANLMIWAGLALLVGPPWWVALFTGVGAFFYHSIVLAEEDFLLGRFGPQYLHYCRRTARWIPRIPLLSGIGPKNSMPPLLAKPTITYCPALLPEEAALESVPRSIFPLPKALERLLPIAVLIPPKQKQNTPLTEIPPNFSINPLPSQALPGSSKITPTPVLPNVAGCTGQHKNPLEEGKSPSQDNFLESVRKNTFIPANSLSCSQTPHLLSDRTVDRRTNPSKIHQESSPFQFPASFLVRIGPAEKTAGDRQGECPIKQKGTFQQASPFTWRRALFREADSLMLILVAGWAFSSLRAGRLPWEFSAGSWNTFWLGLIGMAATGWGWIKWLKKRSWPINSSPAPASEKLSEKGT